jgi:transposase-like protein
MNCKYCGSANVVKYGTHNGVQRYWYKDCKRKFVLGTLPKMKTERR